MSGVKAPKDPEGLSAIRRAREGERYRLSILGFGYVV